MEPVWLYFLGCLSGWVVAAVVLVVADIRIRSMRRVIETRYKRGRVIGLVD